jgi:thioredoxin 1
VTVGKMNVDENPDVPTSRFQVRGIPTLVVLKNGELVDTIVGIAGKDVITGMLDKHLA